MEQNESLNGLEIAVIGMAGRFPGAESVEALWENLKNGVESVTFFSEEELCQAGVKPELVKSPNYVKAKGMISGVEYFDAEFFGFSPADAQIMDPQIRLFYECVWEALESAGYDPYSYPGPIGLFAGATPNLAWELITLSRFTSGDNAASTFYNSLTLAYKDFLTTLISYKLNLKGPSVTIQTACSTSLVALHLACRELLTGGCDIALAGGVCVSLPRKAGYYYSEGMIVSPDGHCRAFDAKSKGTIPGEGAGVVVLKRLEDALEDGDNILAVIKGTGINNDGSDKVGFLAPSVNGQAQLLERVYHLADIDPASLGYIEAHGTGTVLGDPIEVNALKQAFKIPDKNHCPIGSAKTNLGHLNEAAGVTGLIKTIMAIRHRRIPPSLHYQTPNPEIDFENSPFFVNTKLREWPERGGPLRAGVSSFGFGGTNAHAIVEEAPKREDSSAGKDCHLLLLSAKTPTALNLMSVNLADFLERNPALKLADVAYTLQTGRAGFQYRRAVLASNTTEAARRLRMDDEPALFKPSRKATVFMFPGQGSQYIDMGRELYQKEPEFRAEMDRCLAMVNRFTPFDLKEILYPEAPGRSGGRARELQVTDTVVTQPLLFVIEYVLAQLLMKWGIKPDVMIGHSIGEYVAACIAGVFSLEEAISIVVARGKLMQEMPPGSMLSVPLPEHELATFLKDGVSVAALNSPSLSVLSGDSETISAVEKEIRQAGFEAVRLHTSHAFHSVMMEPVLARFFDQVKQFKLSAPKIPYLSNLTGTWITAEEAASPDYWVKHLRHTVRFAAGVTRILETGPGVLIEVGGGRTLSGLVKENPKYSKADHLVLNAMRHPKDSSPDLRQLLTTIGKLWSLGIPIDWKEFYKDQHRQRLSLPTYPFERKYLWIEGTHDYFREKSGVSQANVPQKLPLDEWFYLQAWKPAEKLPGKTVTGWSDVLVFANDMEFCRRFVEQLRQTGAHLVLVKAGMKFAKESPDCYHINPNLPEDYQNLFRDLQQSGRIPLRIIHLWMTTWDSLEENHSKNRIGLNSSKIETATNLGFYSLIYIVQALGELKAPDECFLDVITNNMQAVTGEEILSPEKALVLGPVKIIPKEYTNMKCRSIDIELPEPDDAEMEQLILNLLEELDTDSNERSVAWRKNKRWLPGFEAVKLKQSARALSEKPLRLRPNGVYLITGGMGGIGLAAAKLLAQSVQARLVLTGRTPLPPRSGWGEWLMEHPTQDKASQIIWKLKELEELGGTVITADADIADIGAMRNLIKTAASVFGKVDGVIHCAGVADGGMIQIRNRETIDQVLASKVKGTAVIDELFPDSSLDFCILCSSIATIFPTFGQVGYTAANSFLEAYAHYRSKQNGRFTLAVNWDTWQEVGMAVKAVASQFSGDESVRAALSATGILPLEGMEVLRRILNIEDLKFNQIIVSANFPERYQKWSSSDVNRTQTGHQDEAPESRFARPDLTTSYVAPVSETEAMVAEIWAKALRLDKIGVDDNFFDIGGNSLHALEITNNLRRMGYNLSVNEIYQWPTVRSVAGIISGNSSNELNPSLMLKEPPVSFRAYPNQGFPLSAVQQRFLKRKLFSHHIFNVCNLFLLNRYLPVESLKSALTQLMEQHDSLRISFGKLDSGEWYQYYQEITSEDALVRVDLDKEQMPHDQFISEYCSRLQHGFTIEKGPLFKIVLFEHYRHENKQVLYFQFHHLIADGASLQIFTEDFVRLLNHAEIEKNSVLKTASFKDWCLRLQEYAMNQQSEDAYPYWNEVLAGRSFPVDTDAELPATHQTMVALFKEILTGREDMDLFTKASLKFQSTSFCLMLAALTRTVYELKQQPDLLLHLMSNQRESFIPDTPIQRTMGFFSGAYPVRIKAGTSSLNPPNDEALIRNIKETLYNTPKEGLDYLVLKYLTPEIRKETSPLSDPCHMLFHFVPTQLIEAGDHDLIQGLPISVGGTNSPQNPSAYLLNITVYLYHERVNMICYYSSLHYYDQTIRKLMDSFTDNLKKIIGL